MFTLRNRAFDDIYKKYRIKDIDGLLDLSNDELEEAAKAVGVLALYEPVAKASGDPEEIRPRGPIFRLARHTTVDAMVKSNTVKVFMPTESWNEEHKAKAKHRDVYRRLQEASSGDETFRIMAEIKLGAIIEPGESAEVNWTNGFVEEFVKSPMMKKLELTREGKEVKRVLSDNMKKKVEDVDWTKMDYGTLQRMAKKNGLSYIGVSKENLLIKLQEVAATKGLS